MSPSPSHIPLPLSLVCSPSLDEDAWMLVGVWARSTQVDRWMARTPRDSRRLCDSLEHAAQVPRPFAPSLRVAALSPSVVFDCLFN